MSAERRQSSSGSLDRSNSEQFTSSDELTAIQVVPASAESPDSSWAVEMRDALSRIDPTQRVALRLVYGERLTHVQAARRLRVSASTFAGQLSAAMIAFTHALIGP